jgi:hypothetical protein
VASEPRCWATLDYRTLAKPNVSGEAAWNVDRAVTVHGLAVWFDSETAPGIRFSNSPLESERHIYRQALFPRPKATALAAGDQVSVSIRADLIQGEYVWKWDTRVVDRSTGGLRAEYRQSTFLGAPFSAERLRKRADAFVARPNMDAKIDRRILDLMDEQRSLGSIAETVWREFPARFRNRDAALTWAGDLAEKYAD